MVEEWLEVDKNNLESQSGWLPRNNRSMEKSSRTRRELDLDLDRWPEGSPMRGTADKMSFL